MDEKQPTSEKKGGLLNFWKRINLVTGLGSAALGLITGKEIFYVLAGIDLGQNYLINRIQKRKIGATAIAGVKA